jgi:hypothetical protein
MEKTFEAFEVRARTVRARTVNHANILGKIKNLDLGFRV